MSRIYLERTVGPLVVEKLTVVVGCWPDQTCDGVTEHEVTNGKGDGELAPLKAMAWLSGWFVTTTLLETIRRLPGLNYGGTVVDVTEWGREILLELGHPVDPPSALDTF